MGDQTCPGCIPIPPVNCTQTKQGDKTAHLPAAGIWKPDSGSGRSPTLRTKFRAWLQGRAALAAEFFGIGQLIAAGRTKF